MSSFHFCLSAAKNRRKVVYILLIIGNATETLHLKINENGIVDFVVGQYSSCNSVEFYHQWGQLMFYINREKSIAFSKQFLGLCLTSDCSVRLNKSIKTPYSSKVFSSSLYRDLSFVSQQITN
jgi:hypothetical protein